MAKRRTAKLSAKNHISIPKTVRAARGRRAGQIFAFVPKGAGVLIVPVPEIDDLCGIAPGAYEKCMDAGGRPAHFVAMTRGAVIRSRKIDRLSLTLFGGAL
jgi:bifunctional DNA-binding transcriptional regulator/antitoxin component of YhaV-PrlF toxin-antitoxin module